MKPLRQNLGFARGDMLAPREDGPKFAEDMAETHGVARFLRSSPDDWAAATVPNPRGDLNETGSNNDSTGTAQAIDRGLLTVTGNPNFYDPTLPSIIVDGSISSSSDTDFFSITLQAGELLILDIDNTTNSLDSHLRLYNSAGQEIGDDDDLVGPDTGSNPPYGHNTDSLIHFRAATAGTYYFSVESFQDAMHPTSGQYQLNISIGPVATAAQLLAEDISALVSGAEWNHLTLTYGFPTASTQYPVQSWEELDDHNAAPNTTDFRAFTGTQSAATIQLLQLVANVTPLTFTQDTSTPGQADLRYAMSVDGGIGAAYAYYPTNGGPNDKGGSAWFNTTNFNTPRKGNYAWMGILHETGHALGLKHGHEFPIAISADHDSVEYSVMTYRSYPGQDLSGGGGYTNESFGYPQTLMMYDIAALQQVYGANFATNAGNTVYRWDETTGEMSIDGAPQGAPGLGSGGSSNRVFMTIWDGGGADTYDLSNYGGGVTINLTPGEWTTTSAVQLANLGAGHTARGNIANALLYNGDLRSLIENAYGGAGNDVITGNSADNRLEGRGGNDQLFGLDGNDAFFFTSDFTAADRVDGGAGTNDQIGLQGDYSGGLTLGATTMTNVEVLVVLPGFSYNITTNDANVAAGGLLKVQATQLLSGQSLTFNGSAETNGSFLVYGGGGNDNFTGGAGNDGFYFGPGQFNASDIVNGGAGTNDQLGLDGNYTITLGNNVTNVEVVVLLPGPSGTPNNFNVTLADAFVPSGQTMTIFGLQVSTAITLDGSNEQNGILRVYGGSAADTITGGSLGDWIFGGGGGDILTGGGGADTFYYDDVAQSTGTGFDRLAGFDDSIDRIDLPFAVASFFGSASGSLDSGSMNTTLANAFGGLGNHQAALFTATSGTLAGQTFAVIDANGIAGYQAGADYVIGFSTPVTPIDPTTAIYI